MGRIAVIGQSGTGKSWGAGAVIERILDPNHPRNPGETFDYAVLFDPEDEERGLCDTNGKHDPLFRRLEVTIEKAKELDWRKVLYNHRRIRVVPDMTEEDMAPTYGAICGATFELCKDLTPSRSALVCGDEVGQYASEHGIDDRVLTLQSRGRKHEAETVHIMQRPQQVNSELISQCDRRIYFRVNDDNDLGKINKSATFNVYSIDEAGGRGLEELNDREVVIENVGAGEVLVESTNDWNRLRPHLAKDDGLLDQVLGV
ncbi:ATP-binding protein [Natribaculum luteum]|uniref:ATP-binding protein n=1 Tax=Natribaculum luteum TaxID=1586232 RepID=A0ABD5NXR8_9EURY|nr:ATP-binding protein [Natribaculum luteum]